MPKIVGLPAVLGFLGNRSGGAHAVRQASVELRCARKHPSVADAACGVAQLPRRFKYNHCRSGMPDIEIARPILFAEIRRVKHIASRHRRTLVGIPVRSVRIRIVRMQAYPAACIVCHLDNRRLVGRVRPAHHLRDLLVSGIQPPALAGDIRQATPPGNRPRATVRRYGTLICGVLMGPVPVLSTTL